MSATPDIATLFSAGNGLPPTDGRADDGLVFETPLLNELRDTWQALLNGRTMPSRADFTMRVLKPWIRNVTIMDVVEDGPTRRYRHRFAGSALVEIFGEQTGKFLEDFIKPDRLALWNAGYGAVCVAKRPLRFFVPFTMPRADYLRTESMMIPLSNDGAAVNMLLAVSYFSSKAS